ncbi:MAG: HlyD family efflux transporter periplasmic adaptor subunit [Pseudomonadota bacterium]|nr:HlyD family efflux transporter periplasmic adaptor subunit [Pseudomonadota bacterium]
MKKLLVPFLLLVLLSACKTDGENLQGFVDADPVFLNTPVSGRLVELPVAAGTKIAAEQKVFKLSDEALDRHIDALSADLAMNKALLVDAQSGQRQSVIEVIKTQVSQAQASFDLATKNYRRATELKEKGAIDQESFDTYYKEKIRSEAVLNEAKANLKDAKLGARSEIVKAKISAVEISKKNLEKAKVQLSQMVVKAPVSGYILDTYYSNGEWVPAFKPVASLIVPEKYSVKFYLPLKLLATANVGTKFKFYVPGVNKYFTASIRTISQEATYTPPMVFADNNTSKFVYLVKANIEATDLSLFKLGQPVSVIWSS